MKQNIAKIKNNERNMDLKKRTREELEERVRKLENIIAKKGIGSQYLARAERIQRNINLAIIVGGAALVIGVAALAVYNHKEHE